MKNLLMLGIKSNIYQVSFKRILVEYLFSVIIEYRINTSTFTNSENIIYIKQHSLSKV